MDRKVVSLRIKRTKDVNVCNCAIYKLFNY